MINKFVDNFSKKTKDEKIKWLLKTYLNNDKNIYKILSNYWHKNSFIQKLHDEFSENTISNFYIPFNLAPNFLINKKIYVLPMVTEESSVVAAACKSSKFWSKHGGFKTYIKSTKKIGHVHFFMKTSFLKLQYFFKKILKKKLFDNSYDITKNMELRGGGILDIKIINKSYDLFNYFQIEAIFDTCDAMGANFINSCLEKFSIIFKKELLLNTSFFNKKEVLSLKIIMCILSNYSPECLVHSEVSCERKFLDLNDKEFSYKFHKAIDIAKIDQYRAVTHNKGIMNGIDSVVIATGNDPRAVEASIHSYCSKNGKYRSLTNCEIKNDFLRFWIDIPLTIGITGGVTTLHPLAKLSLKILGNPSVKKLMGIIASVGLAQNFASISSLITEGIQKGHMKLHLINILNKFNINEKEKNYLIYFFQKKKKIDYHLVINKLKELRNK